MKCRKTSNCITLISWSTIIVTLVIWSIAPHTTEANSLFKPAMHYDADQWPSSVAIGDLNGDSYLDLAVANKDSNNVSVLLGNNDGSFQTALNYIANNRPNSIAIGDLNGNGDLDLAVAHGIECYPKLGCPDYTVSVLLGNGDGSFQNAVNYATGEGPGSVAIGDLNGDGHLDLAVADAGSPDWDLPGTVLTMLGNGDGSFQPAVHYDAEGSSIAIGDQDEDDDLDLVVSNEDNDVAVLLNNGDGSFQNAVTYVTGVSSWSSSVAIEDLDGDGDLDAAVAGGGTVSVLLGNGDGSFQSSINYGCGNGCSSVAIGDLNGDSTPDLAVSIYYEASVRVLLGNGDGSFQGAINYDVVGGPESVAIGDLDGDGDLDLAVTNKDTNNVSILINTGGPVKLLYTAVPPCRIADTRKSGGFIGAFTQRNFHVYGSDGKMSAQGGNPAGCPAPIDEPLAAHINMVAVNPTGKGNLQAFPVGAGMGAGLSVNYNTIATNLANAGTVKTVTGSGPDISVASNFSSTHTVIDVLGYYYPDEGFSYAPVMPCRIVDTRYTSAGIIDAETERNFRVFGSGGIIFAQGGNPDGCFSPLGEPLAVHINMVAVNPYGKGNLQAFPVGAEAGAGLSVNFNIFDTNLANAGTIKTNEGAGADITVASNFSATNAVIDVLGYYYPDGDLLYSPVKPCRIVDTRKTSAGTIDANSERNFRVFGAGGAISAQGGNSAGCPSPLGEPLAAHLNMIAVNPTGKGNLQAFPVGTGTGAGLSVNYNTIDTNLANAGTVKTVTGSGADITVASNFSSAHTVIDVLGYYYPIP